MGLENWIIKGYRWGNTRSRSIVEVQRSNSGLEERLRSGGGRSEGLPHKRKSLLEQNENLEIGEEGQWTPEGLSRLGYAKSIYLPALDMLKKMDGIGQYNNNGVNVRSGTSTTTSQATQKPKDEFW